jgi:ATP-dependent DNA ligase
LQSNTTTVVKPTYTSDTLYKKRKDGKYQCWRVEVSHTDTVSDILFYSWQDSMEETSKIFDSHTVVEGKNLGKANETSIAQQAVNEAQSMYRDKVKKGYRTSKDEVRSFQPMLAKIYSEDFAKYIAKQTSTETVFLLQPKLDGCRALIHVTIDSDNVLTANCYSRQTTSFNEQCKDILEEISSYHSKNPDTFTSLFGREFYIDGELYMFGEGECIQQIAGALNTKTYNATIHSLLRIIVYDVYVVEKPDLNYTDRFLSTFSQLYFSRLIHIDKVRVSSTITHEASTDREFKAAVKIYHDAVVAAGYEGAMLRSVKEPYMPYHRSLGLMKVKEFDTNEYLIVDVTTPATGRETGTALLQCRISDTNIKTFEASCFGTREYRKKMYDDRESIVGKYATIQHQAYTADGVPRFPKAVVVRDYE